MAELTKWTEKEVLETILGRVEQLGITNYKLHKLTGISQSSISRYFKNETSMSLDSFLKLIDALNIRMFLTPGENMIEEIDSSAFK